MSRHKQTAVLAAVAAVLSTAALPTATLAQEATTTRIETRAFYGATVTLEAGVRVFRPLPPHSKVIINPGGATPLHVGQQEYRATTHNYNYNYDQGGNDRGPAYNDGYNSYGVGGFGRGNRVQRRHADGNGLARRLPPPQPVAAKPSGGGGGGGKH